jgi:AcrR family transcriptional regulator
VSRVYAGQTPEQRHARRRTQLLAAGLDAFARDGWEGTTVAGVCRDAQISARSFYEHFASREALFIAVGESIAADVEAVVRAAVAGAGRTPDERAHDVLEALARFFADDPRTVRVALLESLATPALRAHRARLLRSFSEPAAQLMLALHPDPATADRDALGLSAFVLAGGIVEALMAAAEDQPPATTDVLVDHLARLYTAAARLS